MHEDSSKLVDSYSLGSITFSPRRPIEYNNAPYIGMFLKIMRRDITTVFLLLLLLFNDILKNISPMRWRPVGLYYGLEKSVGP